MIKKIFNKFIKNKESIFLLYLLLAPEIAFASSTSGGSDVTIVLEIVFQTFCTMIIATFVLKPLSILISKENSSKIFWSLIIIRICILILCALFIDPFILIWEIALAFYFLSASVPIILIVTIVTVIKSKKNNLSLNNFKVNQSKRDVSSSTNSSVNGVELKCAKCNSTLKITDTVCPNCGEPFDSNNVIVSENSNATVAVPFKTAVLPTSFDKIYQLSEDKLLEEFINKELNKAGFASSKLIPNDILKRKKIFNLIFSFLLFVFICLIFFHFPIYTYIIGIIILIVFFLLTRRYNLMKYLKKQVKARPSEKISNIVMNAKSTFVDDNTKKIFLNSLLIAIILPLFIFLNPRIIYEKVDGGYAVRYYIFGLTNFKTATIPETHNNEKVVSLRGNTFSNMPFLESVILPDSITEIRGQAFKNCVNLTSVNIPKNLEYLGGGAFYNAKSISYIELPDTLTYLGGEAFYAAKSLESIKLSKNLIEIRGNTFEHCTSLKSIIIPNNVRRIGAHAFYGATSLSSVSFTESSRLIEIGSSAFRQCYSLYSIKLPYGTSVNERAFKESPTIISYFDYYLGDIKSTYNDRNVFISDYRLFSDKSLDKACVNVSSETLFMD